MYTFIKLKILFKYLIVKVVHVVFGVLHIHFAWKILQIDIPNE